MRYYPRLRARSAVILTARDSETRNPCENKVLVTVSAVLSEILTASSHIVSQLIQVSKKKNPLGGGRAPTMSICTSGKRASDGTKWSTGVNVCLCTLARWHCRHIRVQTLSWVFMCGHTKLQATRFWIARTPACGRKWSTVNTSCRYFCGTYGRKATADTLQTIVSVVEGNSIPRT